MRIVYINENSHLGGAAQITNILAENLSKRYPNTEVHYFFGNGESVKPYHKRISNKVKITISKLNRRILGYQDGNLFKLDQNLKEAILNADIVHINNIHDSFISFSNLIQVIENSKAKVVWTLHDSWLFTGRCAVPLGCERWIDGCSVCENKSYYPSTLIDKGTFNITRKLELLQRIKDRVTFISPSEWLFGQFKRSLFKNFAINVINNGINTNVFRPLNKEETREKYGFNKNDHISLFISANLLDKYKGIEIVEQIVKDSPQKKFIIVGRNSQIFASYNNVTIKEYINDQKIMCDLYNLSDLFIAPYYYDNFPTTVLESLACGTTVLGLKRGGISEILHNCGLLADEENFITLFKDFFGGQLNSIPSNELREIALIKYSQDIFVSEYYKLYKSLL
jgi:glycosyltransferase involved in cell wall biosynthesis